MRVIPGILAPDSPEQVKIINPKSFLFKNYNITPLADFHIKAKILCKENYRSGRETDLSPVDLALGWGKMSDESVLEFISVRQGNRTYSWWTKKLPIPQREIEISTANMHIIPANKSVQSIIDRTRKWDIVEFSGYLVKVEAEDGWRWISSLTREDTRGYSCELVFVEKFEIQKRE
ncbi:MAG: hypothetical protein ABIG64_09695 [Candidatus Omnitrophota bacterium]